MIKVSKYEGDSRKNKFYCVDSMDQANQIVDAQDLVEKIKKKWIAVWFGAASLPAIALFIFVLGWWKAGILLLVSEAIAYSEFQERYYKTAHAGGPIKETSVRSGIGGLIVLLWVVALGIIYEMSQQGIAGAQEWGNEAFLAIFLLGFVLLAVRILPKKQFNKKETANVAPLKENPEDLLPELAVRTVDGRMIPSDVLGPGGRYFCVNNPWMRLGLATIKMQKMDVDVAVSAMCKDGSEGILHVAISAERPISNPFHLIESFKVLNVEDVQKMLDNPAKTAARQIIGGADRMEDLLGANADYASQALKTILGSGLDQRLLDDLQNPDIDGHIYAPQMGIEINTAAVNVEPTEETKQQLLKKKGEQTDREAEMYEIETLAKLVFDLMERMEKEGKPITQKEAIKYVQAERDKAKLIHMELDSAQFNGLLEGIVDRLSSKTSS